MEERFPYAEPLCHRRISAAGGSPPPESTYHREVGRMEYRVLLLVTTN